MGREQIEGWGRPLWGGGGPYRAQAVVMGYFIWDGAVVMGWKRLIWDEDGYYGMDAAIMGWGRLLRDVDSPERLRKAPIGAACMG